MEVHAHTHTARKKWTHYLWEFLMLFLAVFCGFLAENKREHMVEHQREKKYMKTLLSDLRDDTAKLTFGSEIIPKQLKGLDSLIAALYKPLSVKRNINNIYLKYLQYGMGGYSVEFAEGTIAQLKNAGGLRLIKSDTVVTLFNLYESMKELVKRGQSLYIQAMIDIEQQQANHLFDLSAPTTINSSASYILYNENLNVDSLLFMAEKDDPIFLNDPPNKVIVFRNYIKSLKSLAENFWFWTGQCNKTNKELQSLIQKEYHLD